MHASYAYAGPYRSLAAADCALEDFFATGEIVPGEFPAIEQRQRAFWITLREYADVGDPLPLTFVYPAMGAAS